MVNTLEEYADLLSVLLKAELIQKKAILDTLDSGQVDFIGEIIHNFLNNFPIDKKELRKLIRRNTIKDIANFKRSNRFRKTLIKKNKKIISELLTKYRDNLMSLVAR